MNKYMEFAQRPDGGEGLERLVTLVDVSASMEESMGGGPLGGTRLDAAKEANIRLIEFKAKHYPLDEIGVVTFSFSATIVHRPVPAGQGTHMLSTTLRSVRTDSSTNMAAGLAEAEKLLFGGAGLGVAELFNFGKGLNWILGLEEPPQQAPPSDELLRRIVLLTDGCHTDSGSPRAVAKRLKSRGVAIDCIGIGATPAAVDEKLLKNVASVRPDGTPRYCFIGDQQALIKKFEQLGNRIRLA